MEESKYGLRTKLEVPYERAIERAREELQKQGFGVLTSIDVKDTLKKKLGEEFRRYVILGACNPTLAREALGAELEVGLLLPCNVIVYEEGPNRSVVAAMAPLAALGIVESDALRNIAQEADKRLRTALSALERG